MSETPLNSTVPLQYEKYPTIPNIKGIYFKTGIAVLVISGIVVLLNLPAVGKIFNLDVLHDWIGGTGAVAPLILFFVTAAAISIGVPRLIFYALGGALFGFIEGLVLAHGAALLGSLGPYFFAKWGARGWVSNRLKPVINETFIRKSSVLDVFLIRHLPIWGGLTNMVLGVSGVRLRAFFIGSFLGLLPQGVVVALIGSGIGETSTLMLVSKFWIAIFILIIALVISVRFTKKQIFNSR